MSGGWWVGEGRRQIYGGWRSEQYTGAGNQYTGAGVGGGRSETWSIGRMSAWRGLKEGDH